MFGTPAREFGNSSTTKTEGEENTTRSSSKRSMEPSNLCRTTPERIETSESCYTGKLVNVRDQQNLEWRGGGRINTPINLKLSNSLIDLITRQYTSKTFVFTQNRGSIIPTFPPPRFKFWHFSLSHFFLIYGTTYRRSPLHTFCHSAERTRRRANFNVFAFSEKIRVKLKRNK